MGVPEDLNGQARPIQNSSSIRGYKNFFYDILIHCLYLFHISSMTIVVGVGFQINLISG